MKHRVDVEYELDKRWLESKMCNSVVNTILEIFIKSTRFLDLRPPSPRYIIYKVLHKYRADTAIGVYKQYVSSVFRIIRNP
jgi:hypothetical protein